MSTEPRATPTRNDGTDSAEWIEYTAERPLITFQDWLIKMKGWSA